MSLKYGLDISSDVKKLVKELKENYELTDFEALSLALKAEQNEFFKIGFVISSSDIYPSVLEKIAMVLDGKS
jgi:hypothetical protein